MLVKSSYLWRYSKKGVPHVLVRGPNQTVSICWMGTKKFYRIFTRYDRSGPQRRIDFKEFEHAWKAARALCTIPVEI